MGERKVLNKYIPSDFDPSLVPRGKKLSSKDGTVPVRMMLPFSIQCSTCNTFLYRGRKFNSKKEAVGGPNGKYLDIQRWRFYIKCTHCSRPISFLTDPKNADYEMENGATRNYEVYKDKANIEAQFMNDKNEEEKIDPMKALENRVLDSQREMADLDNLEEIKAMNLKHVQLYKNDNDGDGAFDTDAKAVLDKIHGKEENDEDKAAREAAAQNNLLTEEDEALVKSIQFGQKQYNRGQMIIKRLDEEDEHRLDEQRKKVAESLLQKSDQNNNLLLDNSSFSSKSTKPITMMPIIKVKKRKKVGNGGGGGVGATANNTTTAVVKNNDQQQQKKIKTSSSSSGNNGSSNSTNSVKNNNKTTTVVTATAKVDGGGLAGLLGDYSSSSDSE